MGKDFFRIVFLLIMSLLVSTWDFLEAHAEGWRVLAAGDVHKKIQIFHQ